MADCIFCNVAGDALVYSGADGFVILDDPVRPGHVLVGTRSHKETLSDLSTSDAEAVMRLANRVAKAIVKELGAEKVYVTAIGDKDKHFHVHLLPKMSGDPDLGPHIFGAEGWISFLPQSIGEEDVARVNVAIRAALEE